MNAGQQHQVATKGYRRRFTGARFQLPIQIPCMRDRIYAHISWTTRERARVIDPPSARFLAHLFPITCRQERARMLDLGILQTHVHLLVRMHPTTQLPKLLQRLKGASAVLAGRRGLPENGRTLRWAKGYDVESVSPRAVSAVSQYIRNQHRQHPAEVIPGWSPRGRQENGSSETPPAARIVISSGDRS